MEESHLPYSTAFQTVPSNYKQYPQIHTFAHVFGVCAGDLNKGFVRSKYTTSEL